MSWSQQDTSFKKLQNKRITTSTGKGINEEKGASALELYLPDIKTDLIPGTPPGASTSVLSYTGSIGQTLAVDTSVPGNLTWFATSGYGNTTSANNGSAGSETQRLGDWISDKYDAFGTVSGSGYEVKVYDKDSNLITKADPSDWLFDYQTGILVFNNASTTYGTVTSTGPFRVVGYRYIGNKGIISASYGGLGYTSYTKGDLLVGAGSTFIKLNVGSNDYVLTADSTTSSGLRWAVSVGSGITTLNSLTATSQSFEVGTAGNVFNISSIGSSHTFNIPIAGSGSTGLITTLAQTIAGQKTFTSAILADLTGTATTAGYATTAGFATTASYAHQSGYAITSGLATTASNLNLVNVSSGTYYPVLSNTSSSVNGIGASVNSFFSFNASTGSFGATSVNILTGQSYNIGGNSVLSATSLGTGVTNSSLTALGTITTGTWAGSTITAYYGGTGHSSYTKGDILVGVGNTLAKLPVGTDAYILSASSASAIGLSWTENTSVGGSGTSAYVPIWTSSGANLTNSIMQQFESTMIISGQLKAITKSFKIDHPIYPEKMYLEHGSLEGPEHGAYQRGTGKGINKVIIDLPDYWPALVEDNYTIHITSKCKHNLYVYSQSPNNFEIRRIGNSILRREYIEFDYFIIGERKDIKIIIEQNK